MLRIQELDIDGIKYRLREPRLRDYIASRGRPADEVMIAFLGGMLLGEGDKGIGEEAVYDLPLAAFGKLSDIVTKMITPDESPLEQKSGSGSG